MSDTDVSHSYWRNDNRDQLIPTANLSDQTGPPLSPVTASRVKEPVRGGVPGEIILVVEDEERVRDFTVEALRELGYMVIHTGSGREALAILERGQDVALLFTDIVMPEMTGRQLVDRASAIRPQMKVIYTTGYTRNAVVHNGVIDPGTNFLPKPFSIDQLAGKILNVIDREI
ncbi:response regulator [Niveispirillum sp. KHB5.9]|uniref:response regulator n=1 Tax=Niveispirillum sp. KHB5.9 TaxID=3400269 RepID=UPI003A85A6C2